MSKRKNSNVSIGDIYGDMLNDVKTVNESKIKKGGNDLNDGMPVQDGGPTKRGGWHQALEDLYVNPEEDEEVSYADSPVKGIDELKRKLKQETDPKKRERLQKHLKNREKDAMAAEDEEDESDEEETEEDWEEDEEQLLESQKNLNNQINNVMKKKKSVFDNLYEKIISENFDSFDDDSSDDVDALGLDEATPDSDLDDDFGGDEDSVTITLDRATLQTLHDVIMGALGEGDEGADGDDLNFDEGEDEGEDMDYEEDEESAYPTDKVGNDGTEEDKGNTGHPLQKKSNFKVKGKPQPKGGKASSEVTDKVGNDGTKDGQPNLGKQNKVGNLKAGEDYFR